MKSGRAHTVYLSRRALRAPDIILAVGDKRRTTVFPTYPRNNLARYKTEFLEPAVGAAFRQHDYRRTLRTHLGDGGVPRHVTDQMIAHIVDAIMKSRVTSIYNHSGFAAETRQAWMVWGEILGWLSTRPRRLTPRFRAYPYGARSFRGGGGATGSQISPAARCAPPLTVIFEYANVIFDKTLNIVRLIDLKLVARQHDCVSKLAYAYGLRYPKLVVDAPENGALWTHRANPDVLYPGDEVFVPKFERSERPAALDTRNSFRLSVGRPRLRVAIQTAQGEAIDGCHFQLDIEGRSPLFGKSDGAGLIEKPLQPDDDAATLHLGPDVRFGADAERLVYELLLGALDPVEHLEGVQARMNNLGFDCGIVDGVNGPLTRAAVRAFQKASGLIVDAIPGPVTQAALEAAHGS